MRQKNPTPTAKKRPPKPNMSSAEGGLGSDLRVGSCLNTGWCLEEAPLACRLSAASHSGVSGDDPFPALHLWAGLEQTPFERAHPIHCNRLR